jgi:hypothetical protein
VSLYFPDFADNPACAGGPLEGTGILVAVPDVIVDGLNEVTAAPKGTAPNLLPGDFGELAFDLIEPPKGSGGGVQGIARAFGLSFFTSGCLWVP